MYIFKYLKEKSNQPIQEAKKCAGKLDTYREEVTKWMVRENWEGEDNDLEDLSETSIEGVEDWSAKLDICCWREEGYLERTKLS